jgi:hypothetical protein
VREQRVIRGEFSECAFAARTSVKKRVAVVDQPFRAVVNAGVVDELPERALLGLDRFQHVVNAARNGIHAIVQFVIADEFPQRSLSSLDVGHHAVDIS